VSENEVPTGPCCAAPDEAPAKPCALCGRPTCRNCRSLVDRRYVCAACREQIETELMAERAGAPRLLPAIVGGAAGALLGAILWAAVAVITDLEVGYVAIGVGWLAAMGVVLGAGGKKGAPLQVVAVICAAAGLLLGKYFTVAHVIRTLAPAEAEVGYLDPRVFQIFFENLPEFLSPFDALWLILALGIAFRIPRPTRVAMSRRRGR
jgi:hypothetical protein